MQRERDLLNVRKVSIGIGSIGDHCGFTNGQTIGLSRTVFWDEGLSVMRDFIMQRNTAAVFQSACRVFGGCAFLP